MDIYKINNIGELIKGNSYVGRGILLGMSSNGKSAVCAYFIMGRSANSRNRIFTEEGEVVKTVPFDPSKVEDPSLIIYNAVRPYKNSLIVTNGDQTDTVFDALEAGKSFEDGLFTREFEPDSPNFTPRISGLMTFEGNKLSYKMSILKSIDASGSDCARFFFNYPAKNGLGHFIHTYVGDGNPIPTFQGEPERIAIPDYIDALKNELWDNLDVNNKISLYVRYTDLSTGKYESRLINKNR